eukprot:6475391-Ditylum_brightwellii.AAC.1
MTQVDELNIDNKFLNSQCRLNQISLFDGMLSKCWTDTQDTYLWEKRLWTPCSNGTQWSVQVIKLSWDKFLDLWNKQNKVVHGTDETACKQLKMIRYKSIIETMFHLKDCLTVSDHQYMFQSLQEVEECLHTRSDVYVKDWISIWYPFYKWGLKKS